MSPGRLTLILVLLGLFCGAVPLGFDAPAWGQQIPVYPAPPQRMPPSVAPAVYPSTYPSTSSAYPSTNASVYSSPTTASSPPLSPYDEVLPGISNSPGGGAVQASYDDPGPMYAPYGGPDAMSNAAQTLETNTYVDRALVGADPWTWQVLPDGLMYKSYMAGGREPRFASQWVQLQTGDWVWDATLGGRVGMLRYGTDNPLWPEGWQLDIEGAAFPRLDLENDRDLVSADYRFGIPLTTRRGCWEMKLAYYHLSSHLGDEYMIRHPGYRRLNYVRDAVVLGMAIYFGPNLRLYSEADWAFNTDGGAKPWEFQFGIDWASAEPTGGWGAPFFAINGHLREANDYGGNMTVQTGWMWRGYSGHLCRVGMQYFNGFSDQGQFYDTFEEQIGVGLWYDY
ncbi:MAG: DUF1207 domain-containing protein [Pirellulales bacterium]|nr:DUF1207 domain-containing protein [Pirellulales bacterium]